MSSPLFTDTIGPFPFSPSWLKIPERLCKRYITPAPSIQYAMLYLTRVTQAEKMASSASGGFSMFGGRTEKWENAADLYSQAANAFRMQKQSRLTSYPACLLHSVSL